MYRSGGEVWRGLGKNATEGLAHPARMLPMSLLLFGAQVTPFLLLASWGQWAVNDRIGVVAAVTHAWLPGVGAAVRFHQPWDSVLLTRRGEPFCSSSNGAPSFDPGSENRRNGKGAAKVPRAGRLPRLTRPRTNPEPLTSGCCCARTSRAHPGCWRRQHSGRVGRCNAPGRPSGRQSIS